VPENLAPRLRVRQAVKFPYYEKFLAKNLKLASLKQTGFLHAKNFSAFGFADVLPHPRGNALFYSVAKASVKLACHNKYFMLDSFG